MCLASIRVCIDEWRMANAIENEEKWPPFPEQINYKSNILCQIILCAETNKWLQLVVCVLINAGIGDGSRFGIGAVIVIVVVCDVSSFGVIHVKMIIIVEININKLAIGWL